MSTIREKERFINLLDFLKEHIFDDEMNTDDLIRIVQQAYDFTHKEEEG